MKRITVFIIFLLLILSISSDALARENVAGQSGLLAFSQTAKTDDQPFVEEKEDHRTEILKAYFMSHKSPLADYANVFVEKADQYELPWNLVAAISGVESTFGKHIPYNSFNAYGWANGNYQFKNWEESIDIVSKTLREKYINKGADTVEKIARIYAPPSQTWAKNVHFFMDKIDAFEIPVIVPAAKLPDLSLSL